MKIGPVHREIIVLRGIIWKEINASRTYSSVGKHAERAKQALYHRTFSQAVGFLFWSAVYIIKSVFNVARRFFVITATWYFVCDCKQYSAFDRRGSRAVCACMCVAGEWPTRLIAKLACGPCASWLADRQQSRLLHFRRWYLAQESL